MIGINTGIFLFLALASLICCLYFLSLPPVDDRERKNEANKEGVPFRMREWYNYRVYLGKENRDANSFIECFDDNGKYINCPGIGGEVIYNKNGVRYRYKVIGFKNEDANSDWLYLSDCIYPVIEYVGKVNEL